MDAFRPAARHFAERDGAGARARGDEMKMRGQNWRLGCGALVGAMLLTSPAFAQLPGDDFDAEDGNLTVDGLETDWESFDGSGLLNIAHDLPTGSSDNSFGQGSKEDTPVPTVVTGSIPNNKSDLTRFYVASRTAPVGGVDHFFIYLGWVRANTLGTANIDFEFNQSEVLSSNGVTPVRTAGDMLITFDFASGGSLENVELGLLRWITTGSTDQCEASNSLPCWGNRIDLDATSLAIGAVNPMSVTDMLVNPDETLPQLTFGEAALDLTAANVIPPNACNPFASAYAKSRSSDSFTAALKDFIAPHALSLDTCGALTINKTDDLSNALEGAVFTLYTDSTKTTVVDSCTTNASGTCTMSDLPFGTYWLSETTVPTGHAGVADQSVVISSTTPDVTLNLVNPRQFRVITLVCQEGTNALHASSVTFDGETRTSLSAIPGGATYTAADLCGLGGATFGPKGAGTYTNGEVDIP